MTDLAPLSDLAIELATSAGEILRAGRRDGFGATTAKSSSVDIVTEIDTASERHIVSRLRERRPHDGILAEEGSAYEGTSGLRWVIDPLDGTVNFTYGIPAFAVSIGVERDGVRVVGVVYNPMTGEMYTATLGGGAYLNREAISASSETDLSRSLIATGFSYATELRARAADVLVGLLPKVRDIRRGGSAALDLCGVACGRYDGYYEADVKPWDVCAGALIATEAGAIVTGFDGGLASTDVIATNGALVSALGQLVIPAPDLTPGSPGSPRSAR